MRRSLVGLLGLLGLLVLLTGCDSGPGTSAAQVSEECVLEALIAQCPPGSSPLLGTQAEQQCDGAAGGVVLEGTGTATGQCYGSGTCRVVCQFDIPCACGVAAITTDGVECASCEGAASCGNDVCEGGENPLNCPVDCGPACEPDERRCDAELLQECTLQGRWDVLPCPTGDRCSIDSGAARCERIDEVITQDSGVADGGPIIDDGRIIDGDAQLPARLDLTSGAPLGAFERSSFLPEGTAYSRAMGVTGGPMLVRFDKSPGVLELIGTRGRARMSDERTVLMLPDPQAIVTEADYCAGYTACYGQQGGCVEARARDLAEFGPYYVNCVADQMADDCRVFLVNFGTDCAGLGTAEQWPGGLEFEGRVATIGGDRVLWSEAGVRDRLSVLDLDQLRVFTHDPVPGFQLDALAALQTVSRDGAVAAFSMSQGTDRVAFIWPIETTERRALLPLSAGHFTGLALSPGGAVLAVAAVDPNDPAVDGVVSLWDVGTRERIFSIRPLSRTARSTIGKGIGGLAFSPDGALLAVAIQPENAVEIWDLEARERRHVLEFAGPSRLEHVAFSPNGGTLAVSRFLLGQGAGRPQINLWDLQTGQRVQTIGDLPSGESKALRFSADGRQLFIRRNRNETWTLLRGIE